jgi:uncharacterized protein
MRVIITGGTGLIGRALAADLARDDREVIALTRDPEQHAGRMPAGARLERWDGETTGGWGKLVDGADVIVNLAGASIAGGRWTAARKARIRDSRVSAARAVVAAVEAAEHRPRVVVHGSAVGYYGVHGDETIAEDGAAGDDFLARLVVDHEREAARVRALDVRLAIARTGVVFSREGGALPLMVLPFRLFAGGPVGSGRQYISWIHIADHVAALRLLIDSDRADGAFNLTAPAPVTNAEFGRAVGRVLRRPSFMPAPGFAMRLALGEMATIVLDGQRVVPHRLTELGFGFRFADVESALRDVLTADGRP